MRRLHFEVGPGKQAQGGSAELVEAGPHDAAGGSEITLDEEFGNQCRRCEDRYRRLVSHEATLALKGTPDHQSAAIEVFGGRLRSASS